MTTQILIDKKTLTQRAMRKGLFSNLRKNADKLILANIPEDIFEAVHLKSDKVILELIIEDPELGDKVFEEELDLEYFWNTISTPFGMRLKSDALVLEFVVENLKII